jgi:hypothetical protein
METVNFGSQNKVRVSLIASLIIIIVLLLSAVIGFVSLGNNAEGNVLTQNLSAPLDDVKTAKVDINMVDGNLTIDQIKGSEQVLANSTLQYLEYQGSPTQSVNMINGQATLTLMASGKGQPWFRFPWAVYNGATEWQVHLNPSVKSDITAHTGGGNIKLNLASMAITHVAADSGGGNLDVVLPDNAVNLSVTAKTGAGDVTVVIGSDIAGSNFFNASSGAGNVVVRVPGGIAARIHAISGMGKVTVDSRFSKIDDTTYQSSNYDGATDKVEITINSGAGNVSVNTK